MKKSILVLAVGCLSAAILPGHAFAQDIGNQSDVAGTQTHISSAQPAAPSNKVSSNGATAVAVEAGTISMKAIKDFKDRFTGVTDEKWFSLHGGFEATCIQDGFTNRAYYDKKGHWQYSLKFCTEKKIPVFVRSMVRRAYYDFTITLVQVIEIPGHTAYMLHLEDETTHKIIRVTEEGEMDVYEEFLKG
jgi:hypothetical protein